MSNMTFTITFIGYDGLEYCHDCKSLTLAKETALNYSEHGCHCITILDDNGLDYGY
jgi:hypothetical protein